ncbi:Uncharacterized protein ycf36 [Monoraphidium neglectum]|uniref:Uncharacterized protein ycf36 n=1 Tax=Monoraphidium neglectum TaxID=145388 RepID=A0A0D2LKU2_9CHLO|nr:Uncharacterized protein ycf36 [Monoraphidium neglectum]KIZ07014.1 Uncharacterized protein ycf36 [Monoraphidium neglectum]|eukprot:XP_013906033.1 Uncharacterized protein ycf36 [Monoraphidium neglectum]
MHADLVALISKHCLQIQVILARVARAADWQQRRHSGHDSSSTSRGASVVAARSSRREQQQQTQTALQELEIAVPKEQRPVNELAQLKEAWLYSWATLEQGDYIKKLATLFGFFFAVVGGPISYVTFDPAKDPAEFVLSAAVGSLVVVSIACIRIYLGWKYVGDRLFSAAVPYEETGWYDGQLFVKPPEILGRDRLLGTYQVRPVLAKLKSTLVGSAVLLLAATLLLSGLIKAHSDEDGVYGRGSNRGPRQVTSSGVIYSKRVTDLSQLAGDDQLAAEEAAAMAAAMGNAPGYCADRVLRAAAGGANCPKFFDFK